MGKKHPLDIFRNTGSGFDSASRERRTVLGRVVTSAPRATTPEAPVPAPAAAPGNLPPAVAAARARAQATTLGAGVITAPPQAPTRERVADPWAAPRPLRPPVPAAARPAAPAPPAAAAPRAPGPAAAPRARREPAAESAPRGPLLPAAVNRILLVSACVMVAGLALWTLAASVGGPTLKSASPTAASAQAHEFRIQAAAYPGTPAGQASAFSARDLLRKDFADVDVVAYPTTEPNVFSRFDLVVGKGGSEKDLSDTLARLRAIKNWPGGQKQPFKDASVVGLAGD